MEKWKDVAEGGDADGPPRLRRASQQHFWEEDVEGFLHHELPSHVRACCKYGGAPRSRVGHKPLLLATVEGVDKDGKPFRWIARRSRKRVLQPYEAPSPPPPVAWRASLSWKHHSKPGWWVAVLFVAGSLLFLVTGIARETRAVGDPEVWPPGLGSLAAGLTAWPEAVACWLLYFPAVLIQVLEASNMDWPCRQRAWRAAPKRGPPPRPRLLPTRQHLRTVSWWAVALQVVGMLGFMMATLTDLVGQGVELSRAVEKWCMLFGFLVGGTLFTASSLMACVEETGSWVRGLLPTRRQDLRSISWLAVFLAFHGSVGFLVVGFAFFFKKFSWTRSLPQCSSSPPPWRPSWSKPTLATCDGAAGRPPGVAAVCGSQLLVVLQARCQNR